MAERHSVGIKYTGTNGGVTQFNATSVEEAFSRLNRIKGFKRNEGDALAERAAAVMSAHNVKKERAQRFAQSGVPTNPTAAYQHTKGNSSTGVNAQSIKVVTGIKRDDWGNVTDIDFGNVTTDSNGGLKVTAGESEGPGESRKRWNEFWENWNGLWSWYGKYGQYYRG